MKMGSYLRPMDVQASRGRSESTERADRRVSRKKVVSTIEDMNTFYLAFDIVRNVASGVYPSRQERVDAYTRMETIAKRYKHPTLQNKLDEAEAHIRKG